MSGPGHVVRAAVERLNANDLAGYYALMADGIVMVTESRTLTGKPAVTAELAETFEAVSNHWTTTVDRLVVSGDHVATWLTLGGGPSGPACRGKWRDVPCGKSARAT